MLDTSISFLVVNFMVTMVENRLKNVFELRSFIRSKLFQSALIVCEALTTFQLTVYLKNSSCYNWKNNSLEKSTSTEVVGNSELYFLYLSKHPPSLYFIKFDFYLKFKKNSFNSIVLNAIIIRNIYDWLGFNHKIKHEKNSIV